MKEFKLMSINVIAYLKTKGLSPTRLDKDEEKGSVVHYFEDTPELHFYLKEYKKDKNLQLFISKLAETRHDIKSLN